MTPMTAETNQDDTAEVAQTRQFNGPDWLVIFVSDVEQAVGFYAGTLGFEVSPIRPMGGVLMNPRGASFLLLPDSVMDAEIPIPKIGWGTQFMFAVEDVHASLAELTAAGVPIVRPILDYGFGELFTFLDPDGHVIAFHTPYGEDH